MITFNGNWHVHRNKIESFYNIEEKDLNFDVFVRRGNELKIYIQNTNSDEIYIIIDMYQFPNIIWHGEREQMMKKLYNYFDKDNIDYKPLTNEEIIDKLDDIRRDLSYVEMSSENYELTSQCENLELLIKQLKKEWKS